MTGHSGTLGPWQLDGPDVTLSTNPDTIADPRVGFDMRLLGQPGSPLRVGVGAQLIVPFGERADYVSDGRYRGMVRVLTAGDVGAFAYAGQVGVHIRSLNEAQGSEFLFGGSVGHRVAVRPGWTVMVGAELYGETAFASAFSLQHTGVEGLLTGRVERTGPGPPLRLKVGIGHSLVHHFGAPEWRVVVGVELVGHARGRGDAP